MKKHAIVFAAILAATAAHAAEPQTYVSVAAGASRLNIDCAGATACDKSDTGTKLAVGYDFGNGFSLEGGYISFGKFKGSDGQLSATIKPTAFTLGGAFALPLNTDWGMNFRLGVAQVKTKINASAGALSASDSESKAKVYAGLGLSYAISKSVKLELGLDTTEAQFDGEKGTLRLLTVGASFAF